MPQLIEAPTKIEAAGNKPKSILEYVGGVNTGESTTSIAVMKSPPGWKEPGQRPEFDEFTVVLGGVLHVEHEGGEFDVAAGQAVVCRGGEWVRYSSPGDEGADYVAVCIPAFSPTSVRRDG